MEGEKIKSYKDLIVWQKAARLTVLMYELTNEFPESERYTLVSQMRRSALSIPSNIAEGRRRFSKKEFKRFLVTAFSSGAELETQIYIAKQLKFTANIDFYEVEQLLEEVMKMINAIIMKLKI